ncbi:hypothetical protein Hanom_Chr10g00935351 [Helianthus anomalus]
MSTIRQPEDVDNNIYVEIQDPAVDPEPHNIVTDLMIHGPLGLIHLGSIVFFVKMLLGGGLM